MNQIQTNSIINTGHHMFYFDEVLLYVNKNDRTPALNYPFAQCTIERKRTSPTSTSFNDISIPNELNVIAKDLYCV